MMFDEILSSFSYSSSQDNPWDDCNQEECMAGCNWTCNACGVILGDHYDNIFRPLDENGKWHNP